MTSVANAGAATADRLSLVQRFASAIAPPVRWLTQRAPPVISKFLLHLHRPLVGDAETAVSIGELRILINPQDNCGGSLYYSGCYEPEETLCFTELLQEVRPDVFVDIGANFGYYTLIAAGQGVPRVVAVEASPAIAGVLQRSVALNGLSSRIRVIPAALSDRDGTLTFWLNHQEHNFGTGSLIPRPDLGESESVDVPCYAGDTLLAEIAPGPGSVVMKLDVEGGELLVLQGMMNFLARVRPTLAIEVHPLQLRSSGHSAEQLTELLQGLGYRFSRVSRGRETNLAATDSLGSEIFWLIARPRGDS
jgi:FkbM family methyltransferase